jgi:hypothetical protein
MMHNWKLRSIWIHRKYFFLVFQVIYRFANLQDAEVIGVRDGDGLEAATQLKFSEDSGKDMKKRDIRGSKPKEI